MVTLTIISCLIIITAAGAGFYLLKKEYFPLLEDMLHAEKFYELSQEDRGKDP